MTVILEIPQAVEEALRNDAQQRGMTTEQMLVDDLRKRYGMSETPLPDRHERVRNFLEWARNQPHDAPVLSDEAISREAMYARADDSTYGCYSDQNDAN